jgi:hypothetical protein
MTRHPLTATLLACGLATATLAHAAGELPSWNDGRAKQAITAFVAKVTKPGTPDFVPVAERIAVFDNDGTLWAEQPLYFQFLFAIDRVKALSPKHRSGKARSCSPRCCGAISRPRWPAASTR